MASRGYIDDEGLMFERIKILGDGHFGRRVGLYKTSPSVAYYQQHKQVVLKEIPLYADPKNFNEVEILGFVSHPNIVKFLDFYLGDRGAFVLVAMEYAHYGNLEELVYKDMVNYAEFGVWRFMKQISGALKYLHGQTPRPIMHRDIKPDNILGSREVLPNGTRTGGIIWKLADFGSACRLKFDESSGFYEDYARGNIYYMAPEMLAVCWPNRGKGRYGTKADIFSFGAVVSFLCNGIRPFKTAGDIERWPFPKGRSTIEGLGYSEDLCELQARMLSRVPACRLSAADIFAQCEEFRLKDPEAREKNEGQRYAF